MSRPGLEQGLFDPESCAVTVTPPRLSNRSGQRRGGGREGEGGQEERRVSQLVVFIDAHRSKSEVLDSIWGNCTVCLTTFIQHFYGEVYISYDSAESNYGAHHAGEVYIQVRLGRNALLEDRGRGNASLNQQRKNSTPCHFDNLSLLRPLRCTLWNKWM